MNNFNVIYCESSYSLTANAMAFFSSDTDLSLFPCANQHVYNELLGNTKIDALVIDVTFPSCKEILSSLSPNARPFVVVTSKQLSEEIESFLDNIIYDEIFYKPYSFLELRTKIMKALASRRIHVKTGAPKNIDERLSNIFIRAGIPPHIKGYQYLREAVKLSVMYPEMINSITKKLYPTVAETFDTSASKVERAIRHAIEVAWARGKIENINAIFGIKIYSKDERPTNGELIALVADKIMIESM